MKLRKFMKKIRSINKKTTLLAGMFTLLLIVCATLPYVFQKEIFHETYNSNFEHAFANNTLSNTQKTATKPKTKNEITKMSFFSEGIAIAGTYTSKISYFYLQNTTSKAVKSFTPTVNKTTYSRKIPLTNLKNGTYTLNVAYKSPKVKKSAITKLSGMKRIARAKIGSKLISLRYLNQTIVIDIQDFSYQYDILIDPGHGDDDPGAVNSFAKEKNLNLEISLYEKKRYEDHGLKVLLTRTNEKLELKKGSTSWRELYQRTYAMGYYGVVSKVVYSNHHNSGNTAKKYMGYEIIVPAAYSKSGLAQEHQIYSAWKKIYPVNESHTRFYTRDYDSERVYSKASGQVYNFSNYYAVNRLPYELFRVKSVLFENSYMSNSKDFDWYYKKQNWKKISEAKIKAYVEKCGQKYIPLQ